MSHVSPAETNITDLHVAKLTAEALGLHEVKNTKTIRSYYEQKLPNGKMSNNIPVDIAFWNTAAGELNGYNVGLRKSGKKIDGREGYEFVWDAFALDNSPTRQSILKKFGDDFHKFKNERGGHVPIGKPNKFMQEYNLQQVQFMLKNNKQYAGVKWKRNAPDSEGTILLEATGGVIGNAKMKVFSKKDGTAIFMVEGHAGSGCTKITEPFEKMTGAMGMRKFTSEYYHTRNRAGQLVHVKTK